jgi:uncharacterized protein YjdB
MLSKRGEWSSFLISVLLLCACAPDNGGDALEPYPDTGVGSDSGSAPTPDASDSLEPVEIVIDPASITMVLDATVKLEAQAINGAGDAVYSGPFDWTSSNSEVVEVTEIGFLIARGVGSSDVRATYGELSTVAVVTVQGNAVAAVELTPSVRALTVGDALQMVLVLKDENQADIDDPRMAAWSTSAETIASVDSSGLVRALAAGEADIKVVCEGVEATARIEVRPPEMQTVSRVELTPALVDLIRGQSAQLVANVYDTDGDIFLGQTIAWESSDTSIVTVDESGLVSSLANGSAIVTATAGGESDSAEVDVTFPIDELHVGAHHACVTVGGSVYCWGNDEKGQLGRGATAASGGAAEVSGGHSFRTLSLGDEHTCGVSAGQVLCWGSNASGQLGVGDAMDRSTPTAVFGNVTFTAVAAGRAHTCALDTVGRAWCWGENGDGQLGTGNTNGSNTPSAVAGGGTYDSISCGVDHACATSQGAGWCWGANAHGQLGTNNNQDSSQPVVVTGGFAFVGIEASDRFSCGIGGGGSWCWGLNDVGQLGDDSLQDKKTPVFVATSSQLVKLATGGRHACGIGAGGSAVCWGSNVTGQLGDGSMSSSQRPVAVSTSLVAVEIGVGAAHSCFVTDAGQVLCFGDASQGQMGPTGSSSSTPQAVTGL